MNVLSLLLSHGADPTLQDHHGRDPYRVALRNNNAAVAGLLLIYLLTIIIYRSAGEAHEEIVRLSWRTQWQVGQF